MRRHLARASRWATATAVVALVPFEPASLWPVSLLLLALQALLVTPQGRRHPLEPALVLLSAGGLALATSGSVGPDRTLAVIVALGLTLLTLPWLESTLRDSPNDRPGARGSVLPGGRQTTRRSEALLAGLATELGLACVAGLPAIAASAGAVTLFLAGLLAAALHCIPARFLEVDPPLLRVIVQETARSRVRLASRARLPLLLTLHPRDSGLAVLPSQLLLDGTAPVDLALTPPLAGPSTIRATVSAVDPWGLVVTRQEIVLARLRVIPRSAYAAWLAQRYLERAVPGGSGPVAVATESVRTPLQRRGLEYRGARPYAPGDQLRDVFWKATAKRARVVVKDRRDDPGTPVALLAHLDVRSAEEADWLSASLVTSALTLAQEGVPIALGAYSGEPRVVATPLQSPRDAVRRALELTDHIRCVAAPARVLGPVPFRRLRRRIMLLEGAQEGPARRLARILRFEEAALRARARTHPAAMALHRLASLVPGPLAVLHISASPDDADVVELALDGLRGHGLYLWQRWGPELLPARAAFELPARAFGA